MVAIPLGVRSPSSIVPVTSGNNISPFISSALIEHLVTFHFINSKDAEQITDDAG